MSAAADANGMPPNASTGPRSCCLHDDPDSLSAPDQIFRLADSTRCSRRCQTKEQQVGARPRVGSPARECPNQATDREPAGSRGYDEGWYGHRTMVPYHYGRSLGAQRVDVFSLRRVYRLKDYSP